MPTPAEDFRLEIAATENADDVENNAAAKVLGAMASAQAMAQAIETVEIGDPRTPNADKQLFSIGHVCRMLGVAPNTLERAMLATKTKFAILQNALGYIDAHGLVAVHEFLRAERKQNAS